MIIAAVIRHENQILLQQKSEINNQIIWELPNCEITDVDNQINLLVEKCKTLNVTIETTDISSTMNRIINGVLFIIQNYVLFHILVIQGAGSTQKILKIYHFQNNLMEPLVSLYTSMILLIQFIEKLKKLL